jgi:ABC-2 type transport system ATP-binding protein
MIELHNVSKYYGSVKAVEDVSFKIDEGEIIGLLGPNGAGKSTILKILATYLAPSNGKASIGGNCTFMDAAVVREKIGYLPDTPPLYGEMTVQSYLTFVAKMKNVPAAKVKEQVSKVIQKTNLTDVADKQLNTLSHGFKQRVGIAQALVHDPKVIIMDEPMSGLDPIQIVEMRDLILALRKRYTVILSSHILSEITKTCDRILVIDKGRLVAQGSEEFLSKSLAGLFHLQVQFSGNCERIKPKLQEISGVSSIKEEVGDSYTTLKIEALSEIRPLVARTIIENGGELYSINRTSEGLESLFIKIIKND